MESLASVREISAWLSENGGSREAVVHDAGRPVDVFLSVFAELVTKFGAPDFPQLDKPKPHDLPSSARVAAVWEFDYYRLFRVDAVDGEEVLVVAKHSR